MKPIIFMDTEVSETDNKAHDFGAINEKGEKLHTNSASEFHTFISNTKYLCGHNIVDHDAKYIESPTDITYIDTLYLSPLMFPNKPYHSLLKDDKLRTDELNNPLNDSIKAMTLFYDEVNAFEKLDDKLKLIYYMLLKESLHFSGFFEYLDYSARDDLETTILVFFKDKLCENAPIKGFISESPVELAYGLAFISATEKYSLIPRWVLMNYPKVDNILRALKNTSCGKCDYCKAELDPKIYLSKYFGYPDFRTYNGEPLQKNAVNAAVEHKSLLAIFPTGGGKSLTFQIPALMAGKTERALTVVISPLQSLMKDQVDSLEKKGISEAVTINGLLSPIERAEAIERVESGIASILYIAPESLRSVTIERLFLSRNINRFVIDEAHCFSAWGQDFRVDYLYIGDFLRELQEKKGNNCKIPVSCFTATAKQKVISDIKDYFKNKLDLDLELYATNASRTNLRYEVLYKETDAEKYDTLRALIELKNCPTIVYVSRTKCTKILAEKLTNDGFKARAFNGKMESSEKQENQEAFINDEIQIIVATSAFGMGVDKSNVKLVIHYDISDSLENYVQEAGRAGRDPSLQADCYVLFNDGDLDKHFILLNQTKLSISEIQQVWKAVKDLTKIRPEVCCSPLEVARQAGWDDSIQDIETRVKTAIQALENAGYLKRGRNVPRVYATSIIVKNMMEASRRIDSSYRIINEQERVVAKRIIRSLISSKSIADAGNDDAESRVDYLADRLGIEKCDIVHSIQMMREDGLLADTKDLTAYILKKDTENKSLLILHKFQALEKFLLEYIDADKLCMNYKELNEAALANGVKSSSVNSIKTLFYYWTIRSYIQKEQDSATNKVIIIPKMKLETIIEKRTKSYQIAEFIIHYLFENSRSNIGEKEEVLVGFSILELLNEYRTQHIIYDVTANDIEEALLFLSKINAIKLEGGFLVLYSGMRLKRLIFDNKIRYKQEDYRQLNEFYKQKIQQIHIVGEYANMMVRNYHAALQFVNDYFQMDYKKFLSQYFSGERAAQIERNITPAKYAQLFDPLSERQLNIIRDNSSQHIVVSAGPGSGKTRVLVHKLAALLLLEDVKHEQLLMLTFSRAAAIEFKQRLRELISNAANFVEIKTFHSYCFDLLGKIGNIQESENIVKDAGKLIRSGDVDLGRITKTVLVIDEAQDMDCYEFQLVEALMECNEDMRVIAVGDDDQNIYQFRGSDSKYLKMLITEHQARQYSLIDNYRSSISIVSFANRFVKEISDRMKDEDIVSISEFNGETKLIKHSSKYIETAVADDIATSNATGTTCILTNTNQEALMIMGVLKQRNMPAKLIQSMDGFDIFDIAEIRFFLKKLKSVNGEISPVISDEQWNQAIERLKEQYGKSECLPLILDILTVFSETNKRKYRTDLDIFLHESKIEDFYKSEQGVITISTMHKSKGREFDNVFMMLNEPVLDTDETKRKLYVGITRAKSLLHIHYIGNAFDMFTDAASTYEIDLHSYTKPDELIMQLSHKDVYLDFFKEKKQLILRMQSGMHLYVKANKLYVRNREKMLPILQFSSACYDKIKKITADGYKLYDSKIRFICAWKGKDDEAEAAVILPDIYFRL
ncbi:MAG: RecQ family ATP-dependent DNA helicase [Hominimerdicola sp.]